MATYFVDATTGSDSDSGLTEALAWASVTKVNAVTLVSGDVVRFKRGEIFRGSGLDPNVGNVTFEAYGTGAKPIITGSPDLDSPGSWTHQAGGRWTASVAQDGGENPEIMWFDDVRKAAEADAATVEAGIAGDWFWASGVLHVQSGSTTLSPATVFADIQINRLRYGFDGNGVLGGFVIRDIVFRNFRQPIYIEGDDYQLFRVEMYRGSRNNFQSNGGNTYLEECLSEDNGLSGAQGAHGYLFTVGATNCTMFNCTADDNREDNIQLGPTCGNNITVDGGTFTGAGENSVDIKTGTGHVFRNAFFQNNQSAQQTFNIHVTAPGFAGTTTIEDCVIEQLGSHGALQLVENTSLISRSNTYISRGASAEDCWHIGSLSTGFTTIDSAFDIIWCLNGNGMRIDSGCQVDMDHCTVVGGTRAVDADQDARAGADLRFEPRNSIFWSASGNFVMQLVSNGDYSLMDWCLLFRNQALSNNWIGHEVDAPPAGDGASWGSFTGTQLANGTYQAARAGLDNVVVANPLFVDRVNGDFRLQAGSPALNAASDGSDLGALQAGGAALTGSLTGAAQLAATLQGRVAAKSVMTVGAQLGTVFQGAVESEPVLSLPASGGSWMDAAWMDAAWMGGASLGELEFSEQIDVGINLGDDQTARANLRGAAVVAAAFQTAQVAKSAASGTATAAASLGATFTARVNAAAATIQAASFATTQNTLASFPVNLTANVLFNNAQTARTALRGAFSAPISLAASQAERVTARGVLSAAVSLDDIESESSAFFRTLFAAASFGGTQAASVDGSGIVSVSTTLALSQAAAAALRASAAAAIVADYETFSETATQHFVDATFGLLLATTQIAKADLDVAASYPAALASTQAAQAVIDAAAAFAATLASAQAEKADLDATVTYPAAFSSAKIGTSGATLEVVATTIFNSAQIAKADLDGIIAEPILAASSQDAIAIRTGAVAAEITSAIATAANASLEGLVQAAAGLDDIELYEADFVGVVVATALLVDDLEAFLLDVNDAIVESAIFAVQAVNAVDVRNDTVEAADLGIVPEAATETDAVVVELADFAASVATSSGVNSELTTGSVQMSVAVVGGAQWLGTYLRAKWPNIGVAA